MEKIKKAFDNLLKAMPTCIDCIQNADLVIDDPFAGLEDGIILKFCEECAAKEGYTNFQSCSIVYYGKAIRELEQAINEEQQLRAEQ